MQENIFVETEISEWKDFFKIKESFIRNFIFRGQGDKDWTISSSLERLVNRLHPHFVDPFLIPSQEQQMLKEFKWKSKLFNISGIDKKDDIEWLSVMQHYGSATRLVDFTDSFYVAMFMAIFETSSDSAIWCINKPSLIKDVFTDYRNAREKVKSVSTESLNHFSLEVANHSISNSYNINEKKLLLIRPKEINERLYRQQGLFLMPVNIKVSFMDNLNSVINNSSSINLKFDRFIEFSNNSKQETITLLKINIPKHLHGNIIRNLKEMNINSESLFPGIEGLAKSLNYSLFNS